MIWTNKGTWKKQSAYSFAEQAVSEQAYAVLTVLQQVVRRESPAKGMAFTILWIGAVIADSMRAENVSVSRTVCSVPVCYYLYQLWVTHQMDGRKRRIFL